MHTDRRSGGTLRRLLSVLLAVLLLASCLPVSALAADTAPAEPSEAVAEDEATAAEEVPEEAEQEVPVYTTVLNTEDGQTETLSEDELSDLGGSGSFRWVNPVYEGILTEDDLAEPQDVSLLEEADLQTFQTTGKAVDYVRAQLKARAETISFCYETAAVLGKEEIQAIGTLALEHTGVGDEGDYLKWQIGGWSLSYGSWYSNREYFYSITFYATYYTDADQEAAVTEKIDEVLEELQLGDAPEYERIRSIYDYVCANVTYDYDHLNDETYELQYTAYAALIDGSAVCQGYALLMYRMLLEAGIDCRLISGIGNGGAHGWNIVRIGQHWYNLDATWDAGVDPEEYWFFLKNTENFDDHTRDAEFQTEAFEAEYPMSEADFTTEVCGTHTWDEGTVTTEPTIEAEGIRTYTCTVCGDAYTEAAAQLEDPTVYIARGQCGDDLTWKLDENGRLTISGSGKMWDFMNDADYYDYHECPWEAYGDQITELWLNEGVTYIGAQDFAWLENLKSVHFAASIQTIQNFAFWHCSSLENFTLPENLQVLGQEVFKYCGSITEVTIPGSVWFLGAGLFSYDASLEQITISSNADASGMAIYCTNVPIAQGCESLKRIDVAEGHSDFASEDGVLYTKDFSALMNYPAGAERTSYTVNSATRVLIENSFLSARNLREVILPAGLERILSQAFENCTALKTITIPDTVTDIGDWAFAGCSGLTGAVLPSGLTAIPDGMFSGCTALTGITIPGGVTTIGDCAFYGCTGLSGITIPSGVTTIGDYAFYGCTGLSGITIPGRVTTIGDSAFEGCTGLTGIVIPAAVTGIGASAFEQCSSLAEVTFAGSTPAIGDRAFRGTPWAEKQGDLFIINHTLVQCNDRESTSVTIPDGVTKIGAAAFEGCLLLQTVMIPEGVTEIGEEAFSGCTGLTAVVIPNGVTVIADNAFASCENLASVTIPASVVRIDTYAFQRCMKLTEIVIPEGVVSVGNFAFTKCSSLVRASIPASVTSLGTSEFAFAACTGLKDIYYGGSEAQWSALLDGLEYQPDESVTIHYNHVHSYTEAVTKPTCTEGGYTTHTCICGAGYVDSYTDPLGYADGWQKIDGSWYYYENGAAVTLWQKVSGKWYYLSPDDGAMLTGWQKIDGKWYYLNTDMKTGWQKIDGKWYYLNTSMKTGWQKIDGKWYYLNSYMKTGWQKISGKWYYLNTDMKTGWQKIGGKWYYLNTDMKTGWQKINNVWYYFGTNGAMVSGCTMTIDGKSYTFASNGAWIS